MEDVYEDILRHLSEDVEFARWNITTNSINYALFKHGKCVLDEDFDSQILSASDQVLKITINDIERVCAVGTVIVGKV